MEVMEETGLCMVTTLVLPYDFFLTKAPIQLAHLEMKLKIGVPCIVDEEN